MGEADQSPRRILLAGPTSPEHRASPSSGNPYAFTFDGRGALTTMETSRHRGSRCDLRQRFSPLVDQRRIRVGAPIRVTRGVPTTTSMWAFSAGIHQS